MHNHSDEPTEKTSDQTSQNDDRLLTGKTKRVRKLRTTSIISFFILLTLTAFGGIVLREATLRGNAMNDPRYALIFLSAAGVLGALLSVPIMFFGKVNWQELPQVLMSGLLVGAIAAGLVLVEENSTNVITTAASACSLIMIGIATMSARGRLGRVSNNGSTEL